MSNPKITVLMTVFNGEKYLPEAIESILNQTYKDFEFLIVNDGSIDYSRNIILSYNDYRIRLIDNEKNIGVAYSSNKGLELAKGEYIARIDADDISLPERLEKQLIFMEKNLEVGLLGCWVEFMDENGKKISIWKYPETYGYIRWYLLQNNCLAHSAAFYRAEVAKKLGGYRKEFVHSEDYDLWSRMSFETKISQVPEVLIRYRQNSKGITAKFSEEQKKSAFFVMRNALSKLLEKDVAVEQLEDLRTAMMSGEVRNMTVVFNFLLNMFETYKKKVAISEYEKNMIIYDLIGKINQIYSKNWKTHPLEGTKALGIAIISDNEIFRIFAYSKIKWLLSIIAKRTQNQRN